MKTVGLLALLAANLVSVLSTGNDTSSSILTSSGGPRVTILPVGSPQAVTVIGASAGIVDKYQGIPFASPPVGSLRLSPPQDPRWKSTVLNATHPAPICLQPPNPGYKGLTQSEDCLYLDIHTPAGAAAKKKRLPVLAYIYGGGLLNGGIPVEDPTTIMKQAADTNREVVFVAMNYRLGFLGWPTGKDTAANGGANLGLRDVVKALEWVQHNIEAFGGDPSQVTIFGHSAGAILCSYLLLQPDQKLFRAASLHSGNQASAAIQRTQDAKQFQYDAIGLQSGCDFVSARLKGFASTYDCLKSVPTDKLAPIVINATTSFGATIDGKLIPDSPHKLFAEGKFSRVPFIAGGGKDEATSFVPTTISNAVETGLLLNIYVPTGVPLNNVYDLLQLYPDNPAVGSPFATGNETFGLATEFKRASALAGDLAVHAGRRWLLKQAQIYQVSQTWSWQFDATARSNHPERGAYHTIDEPYVFGAFPYDPLNVPITSRYGDTQTYYTSADVTLSKQTIDYWLNFAYHVNPNGDGKNTSKKASADLPYWPQYGSDRRLLKFDYNISVVPDTFREAQMQYFNDRPTVFAF